MGENKLTQTVNRFTKYINKNKSDYKRIFSIYFCKYKSDYDGTSITSDVLFNKYLKMAIDLNKYKEKGSVWIKVNDIIDNLTTFDKIFNKISDLCNITVDQKYIVLKSIYYIRLSVKYIKQCNIENTTTSTDSCNCGKPKCYMCAPKLYGKCTCGKLSCTLCCKIDTSSSYSSSDCKKSIKSYKEESEVLCGNLLEDLRNGNCNLLESINGLRCMFQLLNMLKELMVSMQSDYFEKVNTYSLYNKANFIGQHDVEFNNKLLDITLKQFDSIIKTNNGILYSDRCAKKIVKVFLKNKKYYVLCEVDNFNIKKIKLDSSDFLAIDIGNTQYKIQYLRSDFTNETAVAAWKFNFSNTENVIKSIDINQQMIKYWLKRIKKIYKIINCK